MYTHKQDNAETLSRLEASLTLWNLSRCNCMLFRVSAAAAAAAATWINNYNASAKYDLVRSSLRRTLVWWRAVSYLLSLLVYSFIFFSSKIIFYPCYKMHIVSKRIAFQTTNIVVTPRSWISNGQRAWVQLLFRGYTWPNDNALMCI